MHALMWNWIKRIEILVGVWTCLALLNFPASAAEPLERFEFIQIRMGIPVRIVLYAEDQATAILASNAAYERIREIDRALSDYDPESEVNRLCHQTPTGDSFAASHDLWVVLTASKDLHQRSNGSFDCTIGPVTRLWRISRRKKELPDPERLKQALDSVGDRWVTMHKEDKTVTLHRGMMQLDFGGIAKGYAADEAYRVLREGGVPIALVAVAGDIRVGDPPPGSTGWRVEVEDQTLPPDADRKPGVVMLANQAISTSGDTYQYLEIAGKRYSHIVDPKTGMGHTVPGSVSVIAPTCIQADGLASAVCLLGPVQGLELIGNSPQTEALIVRLEEGRRRSVSTSPNWPKSLTPSH